jgi:hypothetical protein
MRWTRIVLGVGLAVFVISCSKTDGPTRYRVSGEARFDGTPIPYGEVLFTPDDSVKNSGPQGIATIRDGRFDTSASEGKGVAGGPTVVHVIGLPSPGGKPICEYEYKVDLPRSDTTHNVEVPANAGPKKGGPDI